MHTYDRFQIRSNDDGACILPNAASMHEPVTYDKLESLDYRSSQGTRAVD